MARRYVISVRMTGLGDRIICLCAAWRFARSTRRTLLADWRHGAYASATNENLFPLCFETPAELGGVPFLGDSRIGCLDPPHPRHPSIWEDDALLHQPFHRPSASLFADRAAAVMLIRSGHDLAAPTVVFDACVNDGIVALAEARDFLNALRPVPQAAVQVAGFQARHLRPGPVIGLHVRHGNGGDIMDHARYWESFSEAITRCSRAVEMARAQLGSTVPVLLCTDSIDVRRAIVERVAGVICRDKQFRASGDGELHLGHGASLGREDALIEMLLLARCEALIRYPPGSFFSFYPAVMKPSRLVPPDSVYDLQRSCDPGEPLAPALLV